MFHSVLNSKIHRKACEWRNIKTGQTTKAYIQRRADKGFHSKPTKDASLLLKGSTAGTNSWLTSGLMCSSYAGLAPVEQLWHIHTNCTDLGSCPRWASPTWSRLKSLLLFAHSGVPEGQGRLKQYQKTESAKPTKFFLHCLYRFASGADHPQSYT